MKLLILFFNNGQSERMELTQMSAANAHTLAAQMSNCALVHTVRLDGSPVCKGDPTPVDYVNGRLVKPAGTFNPAIGA